MWIALDRLVARIGTADTSPIQQTLCTW
jgi:hypothetical protein